MGRGSTSSGGGHLYFYDGLIDEVGFWSEVLSVNDVSDLYASGNGLYIDKNDTWPTDGGSIGTNLLALWHHDETAMNQAPGGLDIEDSSGNGNHGTAGFMGDEDFVTGHVEQPSGDLEISTWKSEDSGIVGVKGKQTYGDVSGRSILCGKTIRFDIEGLEKAQFDTFGTLIIDNGVTTAQQMILRE